jgi:hypothetical protein
MFFPKTGKYYKPYFYAADMMVAAETCTRNQSSLMEFRTQQELEAAIALQSMSIVGYMFPMQLTNFLLRFFSCSSLGRSG